MRMKLLYYNCTFALFIFRLHKLGIEAHAYAHYTSLLCFLLCQIQVLDNLLTCYLHFTFMLKWCSGLVTDVTWESCSFAYGRIILLWYASVVLLQTPRQVLLLFKSKCIIDFLARSSVLPWGGVDVSCWVGGIMRMCGYAGVQTCKMQMLMRVNIRILPTQVPCFTAAT